MKYALLAAAGFAVLNLGGCNTQEDAATSEAGGASAQFDAGQTNPETAIVAPSAPQAFVNAAAANDAFEMEASKLAARQATSGEVKRFAADMIEAHTESTARLKAAAASIEPALIPDPALTPAQRRRLARLASQSGAEFDGAYARVQVEAHQAALDALKAYAANGEVASLIVYANERKPIVQRHFERAKAL